MWSWWRKNCFERPVDGYNPETKTVYLFNGCYYHLHKKCMSKNYPI